MLTFNPCALPFPLFIMVNLSSALSSDSIIPLPFASSKLKSTNKLGGNPFSYFGSKLIFLAELLPSITFCPNKKTGRNNKRIEYVIFFSADYFYFKINQFL